MLIHERHESARKFFTPGNAETYDSVVRLATLGQDSAWKREIMKAVGSGNSVLDLASGTGILSSVLAKKSNTVIGIDLIFEYMRKSRRRLSMGLVQGTAEVLPYRNESFDSVTSSYLAKYVEIQTVVQECWRVLKHGGVIVFHDFTYPSGIMRSLWHAYFVLLRFIGSFFVPWRTVFEELDYVIKSSHWVDQTIRALRFEGFRNINCRYYTGNTSAIVTAEKP